METIEPTPCNYDHFILFTNTLFY